MQYALMIYAEAGRVEAVTDAERLASCAEFSALARDGRIVGDVELLPAETATCVRVAAGRALTTDPGRRRGGRSPAVIAAPCSQARSQSLGAHQQDVDLVTVPADRTG